MKQGKWITFEGGEGAGKSSLVQELSIRLKREGIEHLKSCEPHGTELGKELCTILLRQRATLSARTMLLLFLAARVQHLETCILPALERGIWVLCDRFHDSSVAYQGGAEGLGEEEVYSLCLRVCGPHLPDLTFYLDCPPAIGILRARKRDGGRQDAFEQAPLSYHERVQESFLKHIERERERRLFCTLNSQLPPQEVADAAYRILRTHF